MPKSRELGMKEATRKAASEALAQTLAVTAMLAALMAVSAVSAFAQIKDTGCREGDTLFEYPVPGDTTIYSSADRNGDGLVCTTGTTPGKKSVYDNHGPTVSKP